MWMNGKGCGVDVGGNPQLLRGSPSARTRSRSRARGQALTETALLLPLLVFLVGLGSFVGQMTMGGIDASNAARSAAVSGSYQYWRANAVLTQATQAATWACNEQAGNGTTCSSSCSTSSPYSATTPGCTFNGTTSLKSMTLTDTTDATTGFKFVVVTMKFGVSPRFNAFGTGALTLSTTVRAMAEQ